MRRVLWAFSNANNFLYIKVKFAVFILLNRKFNKDSNDIFVEKKSPFFAGGIFYYPLETLYKQLNDV